MTLPSQHHSFDIFLATQYGIERAVLLHHLQHWIRFNRTRKKNFKENRTWTYQSKADIAAHFPYLSYESVRYHLDILVDGSEELGIAPVLLAKNFNKSAMDRTLWYAFIDEEKFGVDEDSIKKMFTKGENPQSMGENPQRRGENPRPIPDTNKEDAKKKDKKESARKTRAAHVSTSDEEHQKLIEEFGEEMTVEAYTRLNQWKEDTPKSKWKKNDSQSIRRWVIDSIKESRLKAQKLAKFDDKRIQEVQQWLRTGPHVSTLQKAFQKGLVKINTDSIEFIGVTEGKIYFTNDKIEELVEHYLRKIKL